MNSAEWKILLSLSFAGLALLYLLTAKPKKKSKQDRTSSSNERLPLYARLLQVFKSPLSTAKKKAQPEIKTIEVFDYNGIKILHDEGIWTVRDNGIVRSFRDFTEMPPKYRMMVKELDNRSVGTKESSGYFVEILNGKYHVTFPNGKKKKFSSLESIPPEIRQFLGK